MAKFQLFKKFYDINSIEPQKRKDLNLVISAYSFGIIFYNIITGPALAGFAREIGANDYYYGLLVSIPIIGVIFQIISSNILERTKKRKKLFLIAAFTQRITWLVIGFVPYIFSFSSDMFKIWVVILLVTFANVGSYSAVPLFFSWMSDLIPLKIRGNYMGRRMSMSVIFGLMGLLITGPLLDLIPGIAGYTIVFSIAGITGIIDIMHFFFVTDPPMTKTENTDSLVVIIKNALKNKPFIKFVLYWCIWNFLWFITFPFYNMYCLEMLDFSFTQLTYTGQVVIAIVAIFSSTFWGSKLDAHGYKWTMRRICLIASLSAFIWIFAAPGRYWINIIYSIGIGFTLYSWEMIMQQMIMTVTPDKNRSMYIALFYIITSLIGTSLANYMGGLALKIIGDFSFYMGTIHFDRYKILIIGIGILRLAISIPMIYLISNLKHNTTTNVME